MSVSLFYFLSKQLSAYRDRVRINLAMNRRHISPHRRRNKTLGVPELIAIALGGMIGGGIFTILGISVAMIGVFTPLAILLGGVIAALAAYSYVKLAVYYKDEGARYYQRHRHSAAHHTCL